MFSLMPPSLILENFQYDHLSCLNNYRPRMPSSYKQHDKQNRRSDERKTFQATYPLLGDMDRRSGSQKDFLER
jgi:hypothetical protein